MKNLFRMNKDSEISNSDPDHQEMKKLVYSLTKEPILYTNSFESDAILKQIVLNSSQTVGYIGRSDGKVSELILSSFSILNSFKIFDSSIVSIKISKSDSFLVLSSEENSICVWSLENEKSLAFYQIPSLKIQFFELTLDEKMICIAGNDTDIHLWDYTRKNFTTLLIGHKLEITSIKIIEGNQLISSSKDKSIKLWDIASKNETYSFEGHTSMINCIEISHRNKYFSSGSGDSIVKLWKIKKFELHLDIIGHKGEIYCLAFDINDKVLASGSQDRTVRITSVKKGELLYIQNSHQNYVFAVIFYSDRVISVSYKDIYVDNYKEKRTEVIFEGHLSWITDIAIVKNMSKIISLSLDKTCKLWDINSEGVKYSLSGHTYNVSCLAITHNNKFIISGGWDYIINIWCLKVKHHVKTLSGHKNNISSLIITSDDSKVISASWDGTIKFWLIPSGCQIHSLNIADSYVFNISISKDDKFLFSSSGDSVVRIWDITNFKLVFAQNTTEAIVGMLFTRDKKFGYVFSLNSTFFRVDLGSFNVDKSLKTHSKILGACFNLDETKILVVFRDSSIECWDSESLMVLNRMFMHNATWPILISCTSLRYFALVSNDNELKIWDYLKGLEYLNLKMGNQIKSLKGTKSGKFFLCGMSNGAILMINIKEKRIENRFEGHTDQVSALFTAADDKYIISGSKDFSIKVWKVMNAKIDSVKPNANESVITSKTNPLNETLIRDSNDSYITETVSNHHIKKCFSALSYNGFRQRLFKKSLPFKSDCSVIILGNNIVHIYCYLGLYQHLESALS